MLKMAIKMCYFEAQNNKGKNYTPKEEQMFALFSAVKVCPTQLSFLTLLFQRPLLWVLI